MVRKAIQSYLAIVKYRGRTLLYLWSGFIGALVASRGIPPLLPAIAGALVVYAVALCAYIYNDIRDLETDRINSSDRPLPSGKASKEQAIRLVIATGSSALIVAFLLNLLVFALACFGLALAYVYSTPPLLLKNRFLLKQTTGALWCAISSLGGGAAASGQVTLTTLYAAIFFFVYAMAVSPVGDIGDMDGDRATGRRTLPVVMGPAFTVKMTVAILLSFALLTTLSYSIFGLNLACPILVIAISLLTTRVVWPLTSCWNDHSHFEQVVKRLMLLIFMLHGSLVVGAL